jgi:hypothetical protein
MALDFAKDMNLSRRAMKAELLDAETELKLAYAWRDQRDEAALHRLINAYMRLANFNGCEVQTVWRTDERSDPRSRCWFDEGCR